MYAALESAVICLLEQCRENEQRDVSHEINNGCQVTRVSIGAHFR